MADLRRELEEEVRRLQLRAEADLAAAGLLTPERRVTVNTVVAMMRLAVWTMPEPGVVRQLAKLRRHNALQP
jgi:hypothetical protein